MATPSGNSPSSPASTRRTGRNNKRKLEYFPPTNEQYLQLKYGFLNSHAYNCDICKSFTYGSRDEPQLDYASDSKLILTETQVEDMISAHLDVIYRNVINDLTSDYGYPEVDATCAVLATGICYGCKDPIGNALKHALIFLSCGLRVDKPERQNFAEQLKTLVKFVSMIVYDGLKKKHSYLSTDDFLLWLLICKMDLPDVSMLASYLSRCSKNLSGLQWKEESSSNSSAGQFMPKASVTEDDKLDAPSPHSENASAPQLGKARKLVTLTNQISENILDSNFFLPKLEKIGGLESSQSFAAKNFSLDVGPSLSHATNADAFMSIPSKSSSDASFIPDYSVASIPFVMEKFLSRVKDLQVQLQYWTNWARHKVMQTTNRLNMDKAELQTLRKEKLEATKEEDFVDSTTKKIRELGASLSRARTHVEMASATTIKLEFEKTKLEQELESAKTCALESATNSQEASLKEIVTLKKAQTCERERTLFQEELVTEKRMLLQLQKQLQQALESHGQLEVITSNFIICYYFSRKYF